MRRRFTSGNGEFNPDKYLTIEALEDGLQVSHPLGFDYKTDDNEWQRCPQYELTPEINRGECLYIRANWTFSGSLPFTITKYCNLRGNCLSLLFKNNADKQYDISQFPHALQRLFERCPIIEVSYDFLPATTLAERCYNGMFKGCTSLTNAPELPATTLAYGCYEVMFSGCTSIVTAPELPATTLAYGCYEGMFEICTSLTNAPELPATTLANRCYFNMFSGCSKLNYIKMLATDISAINCLHYWVKGVASTGTFIKNPNMTSLPTGVHGIPSGWTVVNDGQGGSSGGNVN